MNSEAMAAMKMLEHILQVMQEVANGKNRPNLKHQLEECLALLQIIERNSKPIEELEAKQYHDAGFAVDMAEMEAKLDKAILALHVCRYAVTKQVDDTLAELEGETE